MHCVIYVDGVVKPVEGDLEAMLAAMEGLTGSDFGWLSLWTPEADELGTVATRLNLPPLAVEDALQAHQRAKVERYDDQTFVVLKTLKYTDETSAIETGEIELFLLRNAVVTVSHGNQHDPVREARRRLDGSPKAFEHGAGAVVYELADAIVDSYVAIVGEVRTDVTQLELAVFAPERQDVTQRIYELKREVLEFREAVEPLEPVARAIMRGDTVLPGGNTPHFRDVADHVLQVNTQVRGFDDLITSILNAQLARTGAWQNEDMRKISAYAALIAGPTLLAGIWGMNFTHMPELHWLLGYPLAVLMMVAVSGALYRVFRKNHWL
ncbi:magnesium and cobalt transport protein CorA [Cryptosporangium sp. NPDC051539]|uniref:magnesium and cobalt transport protein CorA n=1 Tax=Cryptosporangium sp. NPDC051539 TaxID=3363962 RepID=UPI0037B1F9B7